MTIAMRYRCCLAYLSMASLGYLYETAAAEVPHVNMEATQTNLADSSPKYYLRIGGESYWDLSYTHIYEYLERPRFPAIQWFRYLLRE